MSKLNLTLEGDTHVVITRHFAASPEVVFRAHTDPAIIQRWMTGPEGWTMPVCQCDARPGGTMRYEWVNGEGHGFHLEGEFVEIEPPHRIVHVERMFLPDPTPDNHIETRFEPYEGGTRMTMRMTVPSAEIREQMLATGMADGMETSYVRLESLSPF